MLQIQPSSKCALSYGAGVAIGIGMWVTYERNYSLWVAFVEWGLGYALFLTLGFVYGVRQISSYSFRVAFVIGFGIGPVYLMWAGYSLKHFAIPNSSHVQLAHLLNIIYLIFVPAFSGIALTKRTERVRQP